MMPRESSQPTGADPDYGAPALFGLVGPALHDIEPELVRVRVKGGERLFSAGDPGDSLYVVVSGRLRALMPDGRNGGRILGEIGRGESVGEMALLSGEPRSATVYAIRDTVLIQLTKHAFDRLVERCPQVVVELSRLIIQRYQRIIHATPQVLPAAIAIVPSSPAVAAQQIARGLADALTPGRRTLLIDDDWLRREHGMTAEDLAIAADGAKLASWLHEQEARHDYLVYASSDTASPWTRLCLRQADMVLLVGDARTGVDLDPRLVALLHSRDGASGARTELILLYDRDARLPGGTAEWLTRVRVSAHYHLDPRVPADYERLARLLTGRATGLVLGGGGARGLAHIGVVRAMEEARLPIDLIGGTSIGAVMAAQHALGWSSARMLAESRRVFVEDGSLNDYTLPIVALMHGRRFKRALVKLFGERRIEDLPVSYFCVSTNLTRGTAVVHRAGPLSKWVAASMAIPGLGPPIFDGTDVLVDGGVVNNLPVDVMQAFGRGPVFASNVSHRHELRLDREYADLISPWSVLLSRLNPFSPPIGVPTMPSILTRCVTLHRTSADPSGQGGPDLLFELPDGGHRLLDWKSIESIADAGYRTASAAIERWQAGRPPTAADHRPSSQSR